MRKKVLVSTDHRIGHLLGYDLYLDLNSQGKIPLRKKLNDLHWARRFMEKAFKYDEFINELVDVLSLAKDE